MASGSSCDNQIRAPQPRHEFGLGKGHDDQNRSASCCLCNSSVLKNGRSLDSHAAQTAKAAYIFYNTEHSVPGQHSHFSWFLLSIPGSCRFLFSVIASSTDFRTNSTKFRVVYFWFFGYSQNFHQAFGPLHHPLPSDNRNSASPGASLIFSTWSRRRSGDWGCFSSASSTLWRQRSGDVQKPHELLRNSEKDLRRSRCGYMWKFRCNGFRCVDICGDPWNVCKKEWIQV